MKVQLTQTHKMLALALTLLLVVIGGYGVWAQNAAEKDPIEGNRQTQEAASLATTSP